MSVVGRNKPGGLVSFVPGGLAAGRDTLEVRVMPRHATGLRVGQLDAVLTVA